MLQTLSKVLVLMHVLKFSHVYPYLINHKYPIENVSYQCIQNFIEQILFCQNNWVYANLIRSKLIMVRYLLFWLQIDHYLRNLINMTLTWIRHILKISKTLSQKINFGKCAQLLHASHLICLYLTKMHSHTNTSCETKIWNSPKQSTKIYTCRFATTCTCTYTFVTCVPT